VTARLAILNSMAGAELAAALDRHVALGVRVLDLKDALFGKGILDLDDAEAEQVSRMAGERGLSVHCLSTGLFHEDVGVGEEVFRRQHLDLVTRAIEIGRVLRPRHIRLLTARVADRHRVCDAVEYLQSRAPWVFDLYREAVDRISRAGFVATIENEVGDAILGRPEEVMRFYEALDRPSARFTWDVQNMWQMGTFPTLQAYRLLRPHIGMLHVKGGRAEEPGGRLRWASSLRDASWPVVPIVSEALRDGATDVVCLNPSHGERSPRWACDWTDDLSYLREAVPGLE
jgi:sugar phosphate isomerase/epimerase